jgi:hypothetical protein
MAVNMYMLAQMAVNQSDITAAKRELQLWRREFLSIRGSVPAVTEQAHLQQLADAMAAELETIQRLVVDVTAARQRIQVRHSSIVEW